MAEEDGEDCWSLRAASIGAALFLLLLSGLFGFDKIFDDRNSQNELANTTCRLLNYTVFEMECRIKGESLSSDHRITCYEETFQLRYLIANQTLITSALTLTSSKHHHQSQVGADSLYRHQTRSFSLFSFRLATATIVTTIGETSPLYIGIFPMLSHR